MSYSDDYRSIICNSDIIYYHSDYYNEDTLSELLHFIWCVDEKTEKYIYENLQDNQCLLFIDGEIVIDDKLPMQ